MSGRRLIVVEANEVPPHLFSWYAARLPGSVIAQLLRAQPLVETHNDDGPDLDGRELYPSQTWATLNTGVPFATHGIYWYGDPKPAEHPLYWQAAARAGRRVGIVGTLHSSPLAVQGDDPNLVFAIPDCFAADPGTRPAALRGFPAPEHGTHSRERPRDDGEAGARDLVTLATTPRLGVRPRTIARLAKLVADVARKQAPRERLRGAQFALQSDMFQHLIRRHDPDLAVIFTNHVAAAMHRYWYASFPEHYDRPLYDDAWVARYRNELAQAMRLLDRVLGELVALCDATGRALVLTTSMGQRAAVGIGTAPAAFAVVRRPEAFVRALGTPGAWTIRSGMVPQISIEMRDDRAAVVAEAFLAAQPLTGVELEVDRAGHVLTISYRIDPSGGSFMVKGRRVPFSTAGIEVEAVDDQRCTDHDPVGSVLQHGIDLFDAMSVEATDVAPALLRTLSVSLPDSTRIPAA